MQQRGQSQANASELTNNYANMAFDYHKMSETFTEHFPINQSNQTFQIHASSKKPPTNYFTRETKTKFVKQKQPTLILDELDQGQKLEYRNHPFTFSNETAEQSIKTEQQRTFSYINAKNKKFSFENYQEIAKGQQKRNNESESIENSFFYEQRGQQYQSKFNSTSVNQNFVLALDDYLDYLSQSQNILNDNSTLQTDYSQSQQTLLLQKLSYIKEIHEKSLQQCVRQTNQIKQLKSDNEQLSQAMISQNHKIEGERDKNKKLQKLTIKLQYELKEITTRCKYIQNSFIKEKIENENNKVLYSKILKQYRTYIIIYRNLDIDPTEDGFESSNTPDSRVQKKQQILQMYQEGGCNNLVFIAKLNEKVKKKQQRNIKTIKKYAFVSKIFLRHTIFFVAGD